MTTHNNHNIQISMNPAGFETAFPASELPQTARQPEGTIMYPLLRYIIFQSKRILTSLLSIFVTTKTRLACGRL
jgi:hypothetical protein